MINDRRRQADVSVEGAAHRARPSRNFLEQQTDAHGVEAGAAVFRRVGRAEITEFRHLIEQIAWEPIAFVDLGRARRYALIDKTPNAIVEGKLRLGELIFVHRRLPSATDAISAARRRSSKRRILPLAVSGS